MQKKLITLFSTLFGAIVKTKEQIQLPNELGGLGVVNVRLKIKAQRIKFISRLLRFEGGGGIGKL